MKDEQQFIHNKIISEIALGIIKNSTRQELLSIAERMIKEDSIDGMILGCTELPLSSFAFVLATTPRKMPGEISCGSHAPCCSLMCIVCTASLRAMQVTIATYEWIEKNEL